MVGAVGTHHDGLFDGTIGHEAAMHTEAGPVVKEQLSARS